MQGQDLLRLLSPATQWWGLGNDYSQYLSLFMAVWVNLCQVSHNELAASLLKAAKVRTVTSSVIFIGGCGLGIGLAISCKSRLSSPSPSVSVPDSRLHWPYIAAAKPPNPRTLPVLQTAGSLHKNIVANHEDLDLGLKLCGMMLTLPH